MTPLAHQSRSPHDANDNRGRSKGFAKSLWQSDSLEYLLICGVSGSELVRESFLFCGIRERAKAQRGECRGGYQFVYVK